MKTLFTSNHEEADKDSFASIRKNYEKCGSATCLLLPLFHAITDSDTVSYLFNVSKRVVLERTSPDIKPFNMIVELASSNIITDSVNMK